MSRTPNGDQSGWPDGAAADPSICFKSDASVGFYLAGPGVMGIAGAMVAAASVAVPTTGQTVAMVAGQSFVAINPAGTLDALTVTLPPSPLNGQIAGFSSSQIVTALTLTAPGGASVVGAPDALAVGDVRRFIYQAATTSWYPY